MAHQSPEYIASTWGATPCDFGSNTGPEEVREQTRRIFREYFEPLGWHDSLMVNGLDPTGYGFCCGVWLPRKRKMTDSLRERWSRLAAHLAAANRLRHRLDSNRDEATRPETAEAILTPSGKLEHAADEAKSDEAREELTRATRTIDKSRGKLRKTDPDRAVAEWKGLIAARWTLLDHFETDGKRYLLARKNEAPIDGFASLTPRERQAIGFARLGHPNKLIAYEMGITASTVAVLLHTAARKLGVRSRAELLSVRPPNRDS
jgi:DNA-binding CsgD family transcriptional regulator